MTGKKLQRLLACLLAVLLLSQVGAAKRYGHH